MKTILGFLFVVTLAVITASYVKAQETTEQLNKVLQAQEAIGSLAEEVLGISPTNTASQAAAMSEGEPLFGCARNYNYWNSSTTPNLDHPWSNITSSSLYPNNEAIMDTNGDGLADYLYLTRSNDIKETCLYLNNGAGFDLAYRCSARYNNGTWTYYGDCAEES